MDFQDKYTAEQLIQNIKQENQKILNFIDEFHPKSEAVQHVVFNEDFAHSVIFTLNLINQYLDCLVKDNELSEARTLYNQFGRLKSYVVYTDYHHLTNEQLEEVLENTKKQLNQFSIDFSKLFFSYT